MQTFKTYQDAANFARQTANQTGLSLGIEKPNEFRKEWLVRFLPRKENRYGFERMIEAVEPDQVISQVDLLEEKR